MAKSASRRGKDAHEKTIIPSHDIFERKIRKKFPHRSVTQSIGVPDVIVYGKGTIFYEIKPNREFSKGKTRHIRDAKGRYLNENQEKTIRRLLREEKQNIFIVYYNKYVNNKKSKFVYREIKLDLKNLKKFCFNSDDRKKFDPDDLFPW